MTSTARPYDPTPEQKARADLSIHPGLSVLGDATGGALVQAVIVLTHRITVANDAADSYTRGPVQAEHEQRAADLRAQRDLVQAEILRRMAGGA